MTKTISLTAALLLSLTGCTHVDDSFCCGTYRPSASNGFAGLLLIELGGLEEAKPYMFRNCESYGGLRESSIRRGSPDSAIYKLSQITANFWAYQCNGFEQKPTTGSGITTPPAQSKPEETKEALEAVAQKCLDLGFERGSDELLKCIEKLR